MKCEFCHINEAVGFLQIVDEETGIPAGTGIGPNVCAECAEAMCQDTDEEDGYLTDDEIEDEDEL